MPKRMDPDLMERVARAVFEWDEGKPYDEYSEVAKKVLAALGLDDLDAFAQRIVDADVVLAGTRRKYWVRLTTDHIRDALEAALTATESEDG